MSNWRSLYSVALSEADLKKLPTRIEAARQAIRQRLEEINDDDRERDQLDRALHALFTLQARKRSA
jgi:hypothetical protein